ncbi:squalene/phytoene synthase family protein [Nereida sp. MMG024]|nr:squalene/phytoene synthase family protein [Nereida sp. MMG025]
MSFEACAALVERGDADRFAAVMAAPVAVRRVLFPLFAFNVEVSRAPWVTKEPMIAEMRLQWWRDALEEIAKGTARRHDVVDALAGVLDAQACTVLDGLIAARRWDCYKDSFEDAAHFEDYIGATSGALLWTAARLMGAQDEAAVRGYARGVGMANWLRAIPALEAAERKPMIDGTPQGVVDLARSGLADLDRARGPLRRETADVRAVMRTGWRARATLKAAIAVPERVIEGKLDESPFARNAGLTWKALTGGF